MDVAKTVGRGMVWNTISTFAARGIIFINVFIILQHLSVYEYGLSELVLSVVSTMSILLLPGLSSAIIADLSVERAQGDTERMKTIFLQFLFLNIVLGIAAWAILFFGSSYAAHWAGNNTIGLFLKIVSFTFLLSPFRSIATLLATVELRFADQSLYGFVEEVAKGVALVFFFYVMGEGVAGLFYAVVLSELAAIIIYIPRTLSAYNVFGKARTVDAAVFWKVLQQHRKWSIASNYVGNLVGTVQIWIIRIMLGTEVVGLYAFASGIFSQISSLLSFGTVLSPIIPRYLDRPKEMIRIVRSSIKAQLILGVGILIIAAIGSPIMVIIFPKYKAVLPILFIILINIFPSSFAAVYNAVFNAIKEQRSYLYSSVIKIIFNSIFLPLSIFFFGLPGVGIGIVLALTASTIERTWRLQRRLPGFSFPLREFFTIDPIELDLLKDWWKQFRARGPLFLFR